VAWLIAAVLFGLIGVAISYARGASLTAHDEPEISRIVSSQATSVA
jgi:hypothetical protein